MKKHVEVADGAQPAGTEQQTERIREKGSFAGRNGYAVPYICTMGGQKPQAIRTVVLMTHGLGSSKESPTVLAMMSSLPESGCAVFAYDLPAHGDSPAEGDFFRIDCCLNELQAAEEFVHGQFPMAEICYFSSSLGAYLNLLYLAERPHLGRKSFLRCAAVCLPELFLDGTPQEGWAQLADPGWYWMDDGFVRPLKVTAGFYEDVRGHSVFREWEGRQSGQQGSAELCMIHGTVDETASPEAAERFAVQTGARLIRVTGAGHRFERPAETKQVVTGAWAFFGQTGSE